MPFKPIRRRTKRVLRACVDDMYNEYDTLLDSTHGERQHRVLLASDILTVLLQRYSIKTIMKAKKILGITSEKMRGHFYWHLPTRTPEGVSQQYHDQRNQTLDKLAKEANESAADEWEKPGEKNSAMKELRDHMMNTHHCDAPATDVYKGIRLMFCHKLVFDVKKHLQIKSIKTKEQWRWVYAPPEAIDYLERRLFSGPVPVERLEAEFLRKGWSRNVLNLSRQLLGGVSYKVINGKFYWYDINRGVAQLEPVENTYVP